MMGSDPRAVEQLLAGVERVEAAVGCLGRRRLEGDLDELGGLAGLRRPLAPIGPRTGCVGERGQRLTAAGGDGHVGRSQAAELGRVGVDLDERRTVGDEPAPAPAREQTEAGADHHHEIGSVAHGGGGGKPGHPTAVRRVVRREHAPRLAGRVDGDAGEVGEAAHFRISVREERAAAEDHRRPRRPAECVDGGLQ